MSSYEERQSESDRDIAYQNLDSKKVGLVKRTIDWITDATALHTASPTQEEKDDVLALRAELIAEMKTALGI